MPSAYMLPYPEPLSYTVAVITRRESQKLLCLSKPELRRERSASRKRLLTLCTWSRDSLTFQRYLTHAYLRLQALDELIAAYDTLRYERRVVYITERTPQTWTYMVENQEIVGDLIVRVHQRSDPQYIDATQKTYRLHKNLYFGCEATDIVLYSEAVARLREAGRVEYDLPPEERDPWGWRRWFEMPDGEAW